MKPLTSGERFLLVLMAAVHVSFTTAFSSDAFLIPFGRTSIISSPTFASFELWATSPPRRQPRRNLKKRGSRRRPGSSVTTEEEGQERGSSDDPSFWDTAESRSLITERSIELGQDYWMDEQELKKAMDKKAARKALDPGQIKSEKLWGEVLSPYRQNWIGIATVLVVVLIVLVTQFPELLVTPEIDIPDL